MQIKKKSSVKLMHLLFMLPFMKWILRVSHRHALYFIFLPNSERMKGMVGSNNEITFTSFMRNSKILVNKVFLGIIHLKT